MERPSNNTEQSEGFGSFELDLRTGEARYSQGLRRILAAPEEPALTSALILERVHPEDRELVERALERAGREREPLRFEVRVRRFDDVERVVRARGEAVTTPDGEPLRVVGTLQDVTQEAEVRAARDLLSYVVESTGDAIITKAPDGTITSWNRGAEQLYGYSAEEAIGQASGMTETPERAGEWQKLLETVFAGESVDNFETERVRKDGTKIAVSLTVSPVTDAHGRIVSAAIIARDTTARVRYEERLRHMADHDQLSGLFNRRRFEEELKRELARAGRYAADHSAVLSIDIDNFKGINDSAGHAAGDAVLGHVAHVLAHRSRASDVVARLGGDEFAVLLSSVGPDDARTAAEQLLGEIRSSPATYGGKPFRVTASIGVAAFESDDATAGEVMVNADLAMYAAKTGGRDRVVVYTASEARRARAVAKLTWAQRIQDALDNDRFVLHLQPILELATGQIKHGELLLRMKGDRGKLIAPGAFLPAAERFGLIHAIDRWVVGQAIKLVAETMDRVPRVGINLSGESIVGDPHLLTMIEQELERSSVDPSKLIFEVTETAAIANMPEATRFARGLTSLGCSLALDDFGTGFGSFYYLKHLPVSYVKLDGEFIQNLPRSEVDEHMVEAIVGVSQALGIKTVAESVADEETIGMLQKHRVDYAQGYYVGKPAPLNVALSQPGWISQSESGSVL
ncbi:MAG TPA: EAL domain-containing protein [Solirubrobacteraceae bacterium]|nr:EAL domain-containing protein [Solirubrobacteraceae bacterium]